MSTLRLASEGYATVDRTAFGTLLRLLRIKAGLSQNQLARAAGVDPAYVNRLERAPGPSDRPSGLPSRAVILRLWEVLREEIAAGPSDRERLLVLAGHCPEVILAMGTWDGYIDRIRDGLLATLLVAPVDAG